MTSLFLLTMLQCVIFTFLNPFQKLHHITLNPFSSVLFFPPSSFPAAWPTELTLALLLQQPHYTIKLTHPSEVFGSKSRKIWLVFNCMFEFKGVMAHLIESLCDCMLWVLSFPVVLFCKFNFLLYHISLLIHGVSCFNLSYFSQSVSGQV